MSERLPSGRHLRLAARLIHDKAYTGTRESVVAHRVAVAHALDEVARRMRNKCESVAVSCGAVDVARKILALEVGDE